MKVHKGVLAGLALVALAGTSAWAGQKDERPVFVSVADRLAVGALGSARASADAVQYIGCEIHTFLAPTLAPQLLCMAVDAAGRTGVCTSNDERMLEAARHIPSDAYLLFSWDEQGSCVELRVTNASRYAPRAP